MFYSFVNELNKTHEINIRYKKDSRFIKFLYFFIKFFNKGFMDEYVTTIGNTVYFPGKPEDVGRDERLSIVLVAHEFCHIMQEAKYGMWFKIGYLFPQILFIFSLLTIPFVFFTNLGFLWLVGLLFLAPWPAYWRMKLELEAYTVSLFVTHYFLVKDNLNDTQIALHLFKSAKQISDTQFRSMNYYKMWPWGVSSKLDKKIPDIISGDIFKSDRNYKIIKEALDNTV